MDGRDADESITSTLGSLVTSVSDCAALLAGRRRILTNSSVFLDGSCGWRQTVHIGGRHINGVCAPQRVSFVFEGIIDIKNA